MVGKPQILKNIKNGQKSPNIKISYKNPFFDGLDPAFKSLCESSQFANLTGRGNAMAVQAVSMADAVASSSEAIQPFKENRIFIRGCFLINYLLGCFR